MHLKKIYNWYLFAVCIGSIPVMFVLPHELLWTFFVFFVTGLLVVIADLLLSKSRLEEKIIWTILLVLFNGLILPFYWVLFLKKENYSFLLLRLSKCERERVERPPRKLDR